MRHGLTLILAALLATLAATASADEPRISREAIEWCNIWIPEANESKLPRVLLIGDSITQGYYPKVAEQLKDKASVARITTSKSVGDPALLAEVALVLQQYPFDVIHFNNGLHGWGYSEEDYAQHFPALVDTIKKHAPKAKLIWATITPMRTRDKVAEVSPQTERVRRRNQIALDYVTKAKIPVDDLFGLVENHPEYYSRDGVHFNQQGITVEAAQVTKQVLEQLE
jgi:lysophospholipase L1-like esterase